MNIFELCVQLVSEYGFDAICGAVVIYFAISSFYTNKRVKKDREQERQELEQKILQQNESFMTQIREQNDKLMDKLIQVQNIEKKMYGNTESEETHQENLKIRMQISSKVNTIVNGIREKNNADRVIVLEFHNSNVNLSGMPFAKFSCSYEDMKFGVPPITSQLSNFPFSTISNIVKDICDDNNAYVAYESLDELKHSAVIHDMIQQTNVQSVVYVGIHDSNNQIIGIVCVEYHKRELFNTLDIEDVINDVHTIEQLIDLKNPMT